MSFLTIFQNFNEQTFKVALMDAMQKFSNELSTTLDIDKERINEIWLNSVKQTPQNEINTTLTTCKYVCSRGKNAGQPCLTKTEENGFCKKHKKQTEEQINEEKKGEDEVNQHSKEQTNYENEDKTCKFCFKKGKNIGKRCTKNVSKKSVLGYCSTHIKEEKN
jgi:hypothetical protein